ncbi:NAD(P)/FAD-dependent oxidoreductase [Streptosporangium sp. NPDC087985]|uniref:NAD(P)/FAD-dependent oxidoreductase n=1 Tax=Streptosporangium sp. NPDC087985 TaxID=3366196 RepID=UPI0038209B95
MSAGRVVVAGGGLGALRTVEALRAQGWPGEILVVGDEIYAPYNRPPLSKQLLLTEPDHKAVAFKLRQSISDVTWRLGTRVEHADLMAHQLTLSDGSHITYDALVAATGVRARRLAPAAGRLDCHALRTLDDCTGLRRALVPGCRVVVVGAGFIGCEAATALRAAGFGVDVVECDQEAMQRPLGPIIGGAIRARHEALGVRFHLGRRVLDIVGPAGSPVVVLDDGRELPCAAVIQAVGSIPNTEWLEGNGLDLTDGVVCDSDLRVPGFDDVFAIGDVARFPNALYDDAPNRCEHWQMSILTAKRAATSIVAALQREHHETTAFAPVPWFWSDQDQVKLQAYGRPGTGTEMNIVEGSLDGDLIARFVREGRVVGVVLVGLAHRAAQYRDSIGVPA